MLTWETAFMSHASACGGKSLFIKSGSFRSQLTRGAERKARWRDCCATQSHSRTVQGRGANVQRAEGAHKLNKRHSAVA